MARKAAKFGVIGAISRKGNVVCQIIENTDAITLNAFVRKAVSETVDLVATDEHSGYRFLKEYFPHELPFPRFRRWRTEPDSPQLVLLFPSDV